MSEQDNQSSLATAHPFFQQVQELRPKNAVSKVPHEIALATAIVLIEIAACDSRTKQHEQMIIHNGIKTLFGASDEAIRAIMAEAKNTLNSMRGSSSFAALLKENLDASEKQYVAQIIDDLIIVDGNVDGYEIYLRNRFRSILGLPIETAAKPASNQ